MRAAGGRAGRGRGAAGKERGGTVDFSRRGCLPCPRVIPVPPPVLTPEGGRLPRSSTQGAVKSRKTRMSLSRARER